MLRAVDAVLGLTEKGAAGRGDVGRAGGGAGGAAAARRAPGGGAPLSVAELKMGHELHRFWVRAYPNSDPDPDPDLTLTLTLALALTLTR